MTTGEETRRQQTTKEGMEEFGGYVDATRLFVEEIIGPQTVAPKLLRLAEFSHAGVYSSQPETSFYPVGPSSGELIVEIERLKSRVVVLEEEVAKLTAQADEGVGEAITITHLNSPKLRLRQPLACLMYRSDDEVVIRSPELQSTGVGDSEKEAVYSFKDDVELLYKDLKQTPDEQLGKMLLGIKRALLSLVDEKE